MKRFMASNKYHSTSYPYFNCDRVRNGLRLLVGLVFISSAILKSIGIHAFSLVARDFMHLIGIGILTPDIVAVSVCIGEGIIGILAFWPAVYTRVHWIYPLTMIFFTCVTHLNLTDPYGGIESCGCFGEIIHLNPLQSHLKNLLLLALTLTASVMTILRNHQLNFNQTFKRASVLPVIIFLLLLSSCDSNLKYALEQAGDNRNELEKVLDHFKDEPDPLKYEAAKFLIENMPYHHSFTGEGEARYDSAYMAMAAEPIQFRDSVFKSIIKSSELSRAKYLPDIKTMKSEDLIRIIDAACDSWSQSGWSELYPKEFFFDYVLPCRIYNESVSDWRKTVAEEFSYLLSPEVISKRGVRIEAEDGENANTSVESTESASQGEMVMLSHPGDEFTMNVNSPLKASKLFTFRHTGTDKNICLELIHDGKSVGILELEPTNNHGFFRDSRKGLRVDLNPGENRLTVRLKSGKVGIDYLTMKAVESNDFANQKDYSKNIYHISNKASGSRIAFDSTLVLSRIALQRPDEAANSQRLRIEHKGYGCVTIHESRPDTVERCMEVMYCLTEENATVGQYECFDGAHQKWIFIPNADGTYRIMGKDSGLTLESVTDSDGTERIATTTYSGKDSQHWTLKGCGEREPSESIFKPGGAIDMAAKVFDVTDRWEWIGFPGSHSPSASSLLKGNTGNCRDEAAYTVFLCRSLGIPATVDFTPHWANRSQAHLWSVLLKPDGKGTPFYMGCAPGDTAHYFHPYLKPKVFRHRFRLNRDIVSDLKKEKSVPELFRNPDFIDVTEEYYDVFDITRKVPEDIKESSAAYICVFDNRNWVPVHYGRIKRSKVTFTKMVPGVMYMAATYQNGRIVPFGDPFMVGHDGEVVDVKANPKKKQTMSLTRKYPFMAAQDYINFRIDGGVFQGAYKADFSDADMLYQHKGLSNGNWYDVTIQNPRPYRYFRYKGPNGSYCNINEIEVYSDKGERLEGTIIGTKGNPGKTVDNVFDGDILTGFDAMSPDGHWVGVKFDKPEKIARIHYIPRTDGNCIEIGDEYELMYWHDGDWKSLGKQKATSNTLVFGKMPSGGLYVIRNLTKGHEERIFTYEDGKQIWW